MIEIIIISVLISYIGVIYVGRNWNRFTSD